MAAALKFNRMELAGSLGDLGTILPLAVAMIMINGLSPTGVFFSVGAFYILSGLYFGVTCPVEPMKVISAYAIATGISALQIQAAGILIFGILIIVGGTNLITVIGRYVPRPVVRGVQLSTGILLLSQGIRLMLGTASFQALRGAAEPYLSIQTIGPVPIGIVIGGSLGLLTLFLLENRRIPAALAIVGIGILTGALLGAARGLGELKAGFFTPGLLPYGIPGGVDFTFALMVLVLPQIPMTLGNAVIANADLSIQYFPQTGRKVTYRALCISMALANLGAFLMGGMPMCHGAGGLASRYWFGARTAGSNLIIGGVFIFLALFLGPHSLKVIHLLPMSALGVLLLFAGAQLALTLLDINTRKDLFVPVLILGITLASNLAAGFITGLAAAYLLKWKKLTI